MLPFHLTFLMQKIKKKLYETLVKNAFEFVIYGHWCHVLPCVKCQHDSFILQSQIFLTDFKLLIYMPIKILDSNFLNTIYCLLTANIFESGPMPTT